MNYVLLTALISLSLGAGYALTQIILNSKLQGSRSSDALAHKIEHVAVLMLSFVSATVEAFLKLLQIVSAVEPCSVIYGVHLDIGYFFLVLAAGIFTWHVYKEEEIGNPFYYNKHR